MLRIAVFGCGRIGQIHAANVARYLRAELAPSTTYSAPAVGKVAVAQGLTVADIAQEIFASDKIDSILIATAAPTGANYIDMAVAAGKAAFCETSIDLNLERMSSCAAKVANAKVPIHVGFNRRYDPGHRSARRITRRRNRRFTSSNHHVQRCRPSAPSLFGGGGRVISRYDDS